MKKKLSLLIAIKDPELMGSGSSSNNKGILLT
jgi:hypothetical protein